MSLSKEKQLILKIKEIIDDMTLDNTLRVGMINTLVKDYEDPDYITGPIVGIPYGPEDEI